MGREKTFIDQYIKHNKRSADVARNNSVINSLPRLWLELIIIYGIVVLIFTMISRNQPMDLMIPTLGVFFASAFRLMPSINRILFNTQVLRYSNKIIGVLNYEISMVRKLVQTNIDKCKSIKSTIELINVGFNYENSTNHALYDINIVLKKGGKYGVIGPSGSGKSTLVDIVLGLLEPTKGGIYIDGEDLQRCLRCWQDQIGYVPQNIYLTDNTIRNNIAFGLTDDDIEEELVLESISSAQLTEFIDSLPRGLNTIVGENGVRLSGGQRQRIGIARALYYKPSVLIFDEASSALDNDTEYNIIESIKKLTNETVIIVAHRYSTVAYCDTIFRIEDGVIVKQGSPGQMLM